MGGISVGSMIHVSEFSSTKNKNLSWILQKSGGFWPFQVIVLKIKCINN